MGMRDTGDSVGNDATDGSSSGATAADAPTPIPQRVDHASAPVDRTDPLGDGWSDERPTVDASQERIDLSATDPAGDAWSDLPSTSRFVPGRTNERAEMRNLADERSGYHLDQSQNRFNTNGGFDGTCGIASSTGVSNDFGRDVAFDDVLEHALLNDQSTLDGATWPDSIRSILEDHGVTSNVQETATAEGIAGDVRQGHGVIAFVDSKTLWGLPPDGPPTRDHAISVIGVEWDEQDRPVAFRLNDTGRGEAGRDNVVGVERFRAALELPGGVKDGQVIAAGGQAVVTDWQRDVAREKGFDRWLGR